MKQVAVIGASGTIGSEVLKNLEDQPVWVRAGSRSPEKYRAKLPAEEWVTFNLAEPANLDTFFEGMSSFFFLAPHQDPLPSVDRLLAAADRAGVQEVVFSSGRTTGDVLGRPLHQVEKRVKASGFRWTILRPGWFMQNFLDFLDPTKHQNRIVLPVGQARTAFIDVRDIGAVAAKLLAEGVVHGQTLDLTSEEALDHGEVARLIGQASGKKIEYTPVSEEEFYRFMLEEWEWDREVADLTAYLYRFVREGKEEEVSRDVRRLLGRAPIRFSEFAGDYARHWT